MRRIILTGTCSAAFSIGCRSCYYPLAPFMTESRYCLCLLMAGIIGAYPLLSAGLSTGSGICCGPFAPVVAKSRYFSGLFRAADRANSLFRTGCCTGSGSNVRPLAPGMLGAGNLDLTVYDCVINLGLIFIVHAAGHYS